MKTKNHLKNLLVLLRTFSNEEYQLFWDKFEKDSKEYKLVKALKNERKRRFPYLSKLKLALYRTIFMGKNPKELTPSEEHKLEKNCGKLFHRARAQVSRLAVNDKPWFETIIKLREEEQEELAKYLGTYARKETTQLYCLIFEQRKLLIGNRYGTWIYNNLLLEKIYGSKFIKDSIPPNSMRALNRLFKQLDSAIIDFLARQSVLQDAYLRYLALAQSYITRNLYGKNHLGDLIRDLDKKLQKKEHSLGEDYSKLKALRNEINYIYTIGNERRKPNQTVASKHFSSQANWSIFLLLKSYVKEKNRELLLGEKHSFPLIDCVISYVRGNCKGQLDLVLLSLMFNLLDGTASKEEYDSCVKILKENHSRFDKTELGNYFTYLLNFLNFEILKKYDSGYANNRLSLWADMIKLGLYKPKTNRVERNFIHIIKRHIEEGKIKEAVDFYGYFRDGLPKDSELLLHLANAFLHYGMSTIRKGREKDYFLLSAAKELGLLRVILEGSNMTKRRDFFHDLYYRIIRLQIKYDLISFDYHKLRKIPGQTIASWREKIIPAVNELSLDYQKSEQYLFDLSTPNRKNKNKSSLEGEIENDKNAFEFYLNTRINRGGENKEDNIVLNSYLNFLVSFKELMKRNPDKAAIALEIQKIRSGTITPLENAKWLLTRYEDLL